MIKPKTIDDLLKEAQFRNSFKLLPKGDTYKDLSTIIIIPVPGDKTEKSKLNCPHCKHLIEYEKTTVTGLNPIIVESWKRLVKPMNVPVIEMMVTGREVGDAYTEAINNILATPKLSKFKYILTIEHDNIIPFIPNTDGPLMMLYEDIERGYDVAGGLYWTKGDGSKPLIYGDPKANIDDQEGYFKVIYNFNDGEVIECNGLGMGFTLFKLDIFKDKRVKKPFFKTVGRHKGQSIESFTQDLYFFRNIRKLGYRVCVDTRVKLGHMDLSTGIIY